MVQIPWGPPLIPPTPFVWTSHRASICHLNTSSYFSLSRCFFLPEHQAQHGNALYNVNQTMVPPEHPLWAQMLSSAIKPEIITSGTWDKENKLEKTEDKPTRKPNPNCCSQPSYKGLSGRVQWRSCSLCYAWHWSHTWKCSIRNNQICLAK